MNRFFSSAKNITSDKIIIDDKMQAHHIRDVLRLKSGNGVIVFDENGNEYDCEIKEVSSSINLLIKNKRLFLPDENKVKLTIACAIPKKSNMSEIIDKLTQLGVDSIIPLKTKRVIVKLDKHKEAILHERWKRIASAASLQSQRNRLPVVEPVTDIKKVLADPANAGLKLIPTLLGDRKTLKDAIVNSKHRDILVLIGPEGDFSDEEVELAKKNGFVPISLGDLVLRVETAAVSVASFIKLYYSNK